MKPLSFLSISALLCAGAISAQAHAFIDRTDPKVGGTLNRSPIAVRIWFTENIEGASSEIKVFDGAGKEIDQKDVKVDSINRKLLSVSLPKLASGTYKVGWRATAVDNHRTTGSFSFEVKMP